MHDLTPRLLIVDDDIACRETMAQFFTKNDFVVLEAETGEAALELLADSAFDVVLCDQLMPGMHGTDVLAHALGRQISTPFIMVTGLGDAETVRKALRLGAFDFIEKPIQLTEVLQIVHRAVEVGRRERGSYAAPFVNGDEDALQNRIERDHRMAALLRAVNGSRRDVG